MKGVFVLSTWLGVAGVISSFTLFYIMMVFLKAHPDGIAFLPDVPSWINMHDKGFNAILAMSCRVDGRCFFRD